MNITRRNFFAGSLAGLAVLGAAPEQADAAQKSLTQFDPQVKPLLAQMTLDEKIGQMTQPDQQYLKTLDDIDKYLSARCSAAATPTRRPATISSRGPTCTTATSRAR